MIDAESFFRDKSYIDALKSDKEYSFETLKNALLESIDENAKNLDNAVVLFSGGVDSSLLAYLVSKKVKTKLITVGLSNSPAVIRAKEFAQILGLDLTIIKINKDKIPEYIEKTKKVINSNDLLQLQIAVPEFIALEKISELGYDKLFSGQGIDELFAGYKEFCMILKEKGYVGVQRECWNKLYSMHDRNSLRETALSNYFKIKLLTPYFFPKFMREALLCPAEKKILSFEDELRKREFRFLAKELGLPEKIVNQKKKAMQYDSKAAKLVLNYLKN